MIANELNEQISNFHDWKQQLIAKIEFYQHWLKDNNLNSYDLEDALDQGKQLLSEDQLTVALVGEYSRGKTELINALLFSDFGHRLLPSQAGRTTMCPTEIFYDNHSDCAYLKLLPIETRLKTDSIHTLKQDDSLWHVFDINSQDHHALLSVLNELAATKEIDLERAKLLGFDQAMLEFVPNKPGKVIIPVWRHALLNIESPLLKKGIRFLDTPGLNALGSEPELTISMLPRAQAVLFMLSADTGVTASDMAIWSHYIDSRDADHRAGRFAVLNKIDVLWDDLQGDEHIQQSLEQVKLRTAEQLRIPQTDVLTMSAKQALNAKIKQDAALLEKSQLVHLENLIAQRIVDRKEGLLCDDFMNDLQQMLHGSMALMNQRLASLYERLEALEQKDQDKQRLAELARHSHEEHELYYKKLITLKSSRRLIHSQGEVLQQILSPLRFKTLLKKTKRAMHDSWSTLGLMHTMNQFFKQVEQELDSMDMEAQLADKMVAAIYQRFKVGIQAQHLQPKTFSIKTQRQALSALKEKLVRYCKQPKMFMTEQSMLTEHFFSTFVVEAEEIQKEVYEVAMRWPDRALMPLMQYAQEQKNNLETQLSELKRLASASRETQEQCQELVRVIGQTEKELKIAQELQEDLSEQVLSQNLFQG